MNHRYLNKGFGTLDRVFVVFGQTTRAIEPTESAFHDPALRLHDEALLAFRRADHLQGPQPRDPSPRNHGPIGGIDPNHFGEFHLPAKLGKCFFAGSGSAADRECGPRFHPFASSGSNGTRSGTVASRGANHATRRRCAPDKVSHSRFRGACTWQAVRRVLAEAPTSEWHSIARRSSRLGKTSLSSGRG